MPSHDYIAPSHLKRFCDGLIFSLFFFLFLYFIMSIASCSGDGTYDKVKVVTDPGPPEFSYFYGTKKLGLKINGEDYIFPGEKVPGTGTLNAVSVVRLMPSHGVLVCSFEGRAVLEGEYIDVIATIKKECPILYAGGEKGFYGG